MNLKEIVIFIFVFIVSCVGGTGNKNNERIDAPLITFKDSVYNFGSVDRGQKVTHDFLFTNKGNENLIINEVKAGCVCTSVPYYTSEVVPPGDTGSINIKLETAGLFGYQAKSILIRSNAKRKTKSLIVKAFVE